MPVFGGSVIRVWRGGGKGITEYSRSFIERNSVFAEIRGGLSWVPFELHCYSVAGSAEGVGLGYLSLLECTRLSLERGASLTSK